MRQLNEQEAIAFSRSGEWRSWDTNKLALFVLMQDRMCIPFDEFKRVLCESLGRPVFSHEAFIKSSDLIHELLGVKKSPSLDDHLEKLANIFPDTEIIKIQQHANPEPNNL